MNNLDKSLPGKKRFKLKIYKFSGNKIRCLEWSPILENDHKRRKTETETPGKVLKNLCK